MQHRLRMRPVIEYKDLAKFVMQIDALDNVVWGTTNRWPPPLCCGRSYEYEPTRPKHSIGALVSRLDGGDDTVGSIRAGRMTSHWGMGLLANDGNGFDDRFGENYTGNTFDRVLFATRPIALAQAIAGKRTRKFPYSPQSVSTVSSKTR